MNYEIEWCSFGVGRGQTLGLVDHDLRLLVIILIIIFLWHESRQVVSSGLICDLRLLEVCLLSRLIHVLVGLYFSGLRGVAAAEHWNQSR